MLVHNVGGLGYQQGLYNGISAADKNNADNIYAKAQNPIADDTYDGINAADAEGDYAKAENSSKGKTILGILGGVLGAGAIAALAIFGKKGNLFSKIQNAFNSAEGKNVFQKLKNIATKDNLKKGLKAIKDGAVATGTKAGASAKELIETAKTKGKDTADLVKTKLKTLKNTDA